MKLKMQDKKNSPGSRERHTFLRLFSILLFILLGSTTSRSWGQHLDTPLKDLEGKKILLSELCRQQPLVISFWATWCKPCQAELKQLHKLCQVYADSGIAFLAVSIDAARDQTKVKSLVSGNGYSFVTALDQEQRAMKKFGFNDVPGTVILNSQGEIVWKHSGYKPGDELKLEEQIKNLLISLTKGNTGLQEINREKAR